MWRGAGSKVCASPRETQPPRNRGGGPIVTLISAEAISRTAVGDLENGSTNRAAQVSTPIKLLTQGYFSPAIKSLMARCLGGRLGFAKAGHSAAYRQLPLAPQQGREAFLPNAQFFGSAASAHQYNCLSRIIASLATRLLKNPTMGYLERPF